jgi:hypothetical protein
VRRFDVRQLRPQAISRESSQADALLHVMNSELRLVESG